MDLNSISSNLLLVGLILISLCCLYLLYSNFSKVREIEDLKRRVEDLKKIFLNQQLHNDETFSKINTVLFQTLGQPTPSLHPSIPSSEMSSALTTTESVNSEIANEIIQGINTNTNTNTNTNNINNSNSNNTKVIAIDSNMSGKNMTNVSEMSNNVVINKEGHEESASIVNGMAVKETDQKEINIDLHDLDDLNDVNSQSDDNCEEIEIDNMIQHESSGNVCEDNNDDEYDELVINKDAVFNLDVVNNINTEIFDDLEDTLSIATEPIGDSNDVINSHANFNLDEIKDIDDLDIDISNEDIITQTPTTTTIKNVVTSRELDIDTNKLDDILNGNQIKHSSTNDSGNENVKKIEISKPTGIDVSTLNSMSIKQLKDLAKSHKLKTTGTKQELINTILVSGVTF